MKKFFQKQYKTITWALVAAILVLSGSQIPAVHALIGSEVGPGSSVSGHTIRQTFADGNGLIAWYPLNGDFKDYSGGNRTLTPYGATTPTFVKGKFGEAVSLNGTDQALQMPDTLNAGAYSATTFSAWVNITSYTNNAMLFGTAQHPALSIFYDGTALWQPDGNNYNNTYLREPTPPANMWYLVTGTFDSVTGVSDLYINGVIAGTQTFSGSGSSEVGLGTAGCSQAYTIGAATSCGGGSVFAGTEIAGLIQDVRMYGRALSAPEVLSMYKGSQPISCDQSCVEWLKFDESSGSSAANSVAGAGAATLDNFTFDNATNGWMPGVFGNSLLFTYFYGTNTDAYVPHTASQDITGQITMSAWVNVSTFPSAGNWATIMEKGYDGTYEPYVLRFYNSSGTVNIEAQVDTTVTGYLPVDLPVPSNFTTGQWHMLTGVYTGSAMKLYVDGLLVATNPGTGPIGTTSYPLYFGVSDIAGGISRNYNGYIDDARVYNRALSANEIAEQYSAGR